VTGGKAVNNADVAERLLPWFARQLPEAEKLRLENFDHVQIGHSAEMLLLTLAWRAAGADERRDVVLRVQPQLPWLLEPYDLRRQFDILRALEGTPVRSPRVLWIDEHGEALGRPFYVMERLPGTVYEHRIPDELKQSPERVRRMAERAFEQIAAIHNTDLRAAGWHHLGGSGGHGYLDRELDHWDSEIRRWQPGPVPALERLSAGLRASRPEPTPRVTLVHGDVKGGNFAFASDKVNGADEVSGVFDWEMAAIGDPMADIGWAEVTWGSTLPFSMLSPADFDQLLARYEQLTGIAVHDRPWHQAMQAFKMSVIMLVGGMLYQGGHTRSRRFAYMPLSGPPAVQLGLRALGLKTDDVHVGWPDCGITGIGDAR
jgi:aminoglycoside phosphotransferase (APT) family kinase protein